MKKLIKNILVLVVLFTALLANANASLNDLKDAKRTTLTIKNVKQGDELLIKDAYGVILYKEMIQNSGKYTKGFDLTALPKGNYFFELIKDSEIRVIPFNVSNNRVAFTNKEEITIFKPMVRNTDNKIYFSKLSLNLEPVRVEISYENTDSDEFNLIYSEIFNNTVNISRILNLDLEKKGKYRIVTKTEGRTFIDYIQF